MCIDCLAGPRRRQTVGVRRCGARHGGASVSAARRNRSACVRRTTNFLVAAAGRSRVCTIGDAKTPAACVGLLLILVLAVGRSLGPGGLGGGMNGMEEENWAERKGF